MIDESTCVTDDKLPPTAEEILEAYKKAKAEIDQLADVPLVEIYVFSQSMYDLLQGACDKLRAHHEPGAATVSFANLMGIRFEIEQTALKVHRRVLFLRLCREINAVGVCTPSELAELNDESTPCAPEAKT